MDWESWEVTNNNTSNQMTKSSNRSSGANRIESSKVAVSSVVLNGWRPRSQPSPTRILEQQQRHDDDGDDDKHTHTLDGCFSQLIKHFSYASKLQPACCRRHRLSVAAHHQLVGWFVSSSPSNVMRLPTTTTTVTSVMLLSTSLQSVGWLDG